MATILSGAQVGPSGDKGLPGNPSIPIGSLIDFAGATAPSGWLLCYGQTISRVTYATLFNVIGTIYGAGDGSTTFALPDLRGYVLAGKDNMGGAASGRMISTYGPDGTVLGAVGGNQNHVQSLNEIASHNHSETIAYVYGRILQPGTAYDYYVSGSGSTGYTGGSWNATVVQPTFIVNKIIYAGA